MKKVLLIMLTIVLLFSGAACTQQEQRLEVTKPADEPKAENTTQPEITAENTAVEDPFNPLDLLKEEFNLFSDLDFPEGYTVYAACAELEQYNLYRLYMTAEGNPDEIITYMSELLGDSAKESIQQNIDSFNSDGSCSIYGTQVDEGLKADCEISLTDRDDDYEYVDGCTINLVMGIGQDDAAEYKKLIEDNYNLSSLNAVNYYFDFSTLPENIEIKVNTFKNYVQTFARYQADDVDTVKENMFANIKYDYSEENRLSFRYGDLNVDIHFDSQNGLIYLSQFLNDTQASLKDYISEDTLKNFGFNIYVEEEAFCAYHDEDKGVYFSLNRSEWGEPELDEDKDAITFSTNINQYSLVVRYYPKDETYAVQTDKEEISAKYTYNEAKDEYSDEWTNAKISVKEIFEDVFQKPGTDSILQDAVTTFYAYADDTFGMSPKELFELPYE